MPKIARHNTSELLRLWSALVGTAPLRKWSARLEETPKSQRDTSVVFAKDPPMLKSARWSISEGKQSFLGEEESWI